MGYVLRARALWKSYAAGVEGCSARIWVLRGASLDVAAGECVAILGARSAGTTTLLQCLAGLRRIDGGSIERASDARFIADPSEVAADEMRRGPHLILYDDRGGPALGERVGREMRLRAPASGALIVATHELARVRSVADRVMLLRDGRLVHLDRSAGVRRVAERSVLEGRG